MRCVESPDEVQDVSINGRNVRHQQSGMKSEDHVWDEIFIGLDPPHHWTYRSWSRGSRVYRGQKVVVNRGEMLRIVKGVGNPSQSESEAKENPLDEWFD